MNDRSGKCFFIKLSIKKRTLPKCLLANPPNISEITIQYKSSD